MVPISFYSSISLNNASAVVNVFVILSSGETFKDGQS